MPERKRYSLFGNLGINERCVLAELDDEETLTYTAEYVDRIQREPVRIEVLA
jgi:hypothetical protein